MIKKTLMALLLLTFSQSVEAQFWKKIKNKIEKKASEKVDKILFPKVEGKKDSEDKKEKRTKAVIIKNETLDLWTNYDFVPGENVLFYDTFKDDEYGAFPKRWDINLGSAEIARVNGEKVFLLNGNSSVYPLLTNFDFTKRTSIELDIYCGEKFWKRGISNKYSIKLWDKADKYDTYKKSFKASKLREIEIRKNGDVLKVSMGDFGRGIALKDVKNKIGWHHLVIVSNGKDLFQLYFDELKILNLPKLGTFPTGVTIQVDEFGNQKNNSMAIKAIKIAQGGNSLYKQIITNGNFSTNGILFNTGKSKLKPESSGVLKSIANLLLDNPGWKFEIVGHTDNVGEKKDNLILSQNRAKSVQKVLIKLGIQASRLTTLGRGESEPLNTNSTTEERANNRRVVFKLKK
ncbi:OmpA family protein [uncultured Tenacibaculum sp.]|uniref:OmpA family protein n=1 Tax=uncultured Tenacibaculum sp. TaxID=174713 RepID=UPI00262CAF56|nr:OmpA family protein [uncultured Tenacibaculum sp.]